MVRVNNSHIFEWFFVLLISLKLTLLPVYQGLYSIFSISGPVQGAATYYDAGGYGHTEWIQLIMMNGISFLCLWLVLRLLVNRRIGLLFLSVLASILCFSSVAKIRLLGVPVEFQDIYEIGNAMGVTSTIRAELPITDYLLFLDSFVLLLFWKKINRNETQFYKRVWSAFRKPSGIINLLKINAVSILGLALLSLIVHKYSVQADPEWANKQEYEMSQYIPGLVKYRSMGVLNYFVTSAIENLNTQKLLVTEAPSKGLVSDAMAILSNKREERAGGHKPEMPNVIVILMESLGRIGIDAPVLQKSNINVVPFINSLKDELIWSTKVFSPVIGGITCESEFMVMNSLIPKTDNGITYSRFMGREYRSLPNILREKGYYSAVYVGHFRDFWHRINAYDKLGFDRYESLENFTVYRKVGLALSDNDFFSQMSLKLKELPQPFFAFLITLTGHRPYIIPDYLQSGITRNLNTVTQHARNYLETMNYADRALNLFWNMTEDLRENSIVVIFGDHGPHFLEADARSLGYGENFNGSSVRFQVPLVISAPFLRDKFDPVYNANADQADIAPTILNLLGIPIPDYFVGGSIFDTGNTGMNAPYGKVRQVYGQTTAYDTATKKCTDMRENVLSAEQCDDLKAVAESATVISDDIIIGHRYAYE